MTDQFKLSAINYKTAQSREIGSNAPHNELALPVLKCSALVDILGLREMVRV